MAEKSATARIETRKKLCIDDLMHEVKKAGPQCT
jgi:hypothetical protein